MTYKSLSFIHSLLEQEAKKRYSLYKEAAARYDQEKEGQHRTNELKRLVHLRDEAFTYYGEAAHALDDFEDQDFR